MGHLQKDTPPQEAVTAHDLHQPRKQHQAAVLRDVGVGVNKYLHHHGDDLLLILTSSMGLLLLTGLEKLEISDSLSVRQDSSIEMISNLTKFLMSQTSILIIHERTDLQ